MIPVPLTHVPAMAPLIAARIEESHLQNRLTTDRALDKMHHIIATGIGEAFTDDLNNPTVVLLLHTGESIILAETFCNVLLLYVKKEERSVAKALNAGRFIEEYARSKKCDVISGDSWVYEGSDGIGAFWKRLGYKEQAINYVKHLR